MAAVGASAEREMGFSDFDFYPSICFSSENMIMKPVSQDSLNDISQIHGFVEL